jgi:hypothetical protein
MQHTFTTRQGYIAIGAVACVVVLAFGVGFRFGVRSVSVPEPVVLASQTPLPTPVATPVAPTKLPKSYSDVAAVYEGRRIAIGDDCSIAPQDMTYSSGASVMLDNRSREPRTITIGSSTYTLAGFGWRIITLWSKTPPVILPVGCGGSDVGVILLKE